MHVETVPGEQLSSSGWNYAEIQLIWINFSPTMHLEWHKNLQAKLNGIIPIFILAVVIHIGLDIA